MHVDRIPNRSSPPAYLLRETYREGKKVRKRTLANITHWPAAQIEALRGVLRGGVVGGGGRARAELAAQSAARPRRGGAGKPAQAGARSGAVAGRPTAGALGGVVDRHAGGAPHRSGLQAGDSASARRRDRFLFARCGARSCSGRRAGTL